MIDTGAKIKELRIKKGLTQKELGDILHVSFQAVSKWERGIGLPDPALMPEIARALDTDVNTLFYGGEGDEGADAAKKSAYKPINVKFYIIITACLLAFIGAFTAIFLVTSQKKALRSAIATAAEIYSDESNIRIEWAFEGTKYTFVQKYFFDGRVILYFSEEDGSSFKEACYYGGILYGVLDGAVTKKVSGAREGDFFSALPPAYVFAIKEGDVDGIRRDGRFIAFKLKNHDNLPIAPYFGFTADAKCRILLNNARICALALKEGDKTLEVSYLFGYDFIFTLPGFVSQ